MTDKYVVVKLLLGQQLILSPHNTGAFALVPLLDDVSACHWCEQLRDAYPDEVFAIMEVNEVNYGQR